MRRIYYVVFRAETRAGCGVCIFYVHIITRIYTTQQMIAEGWCIGLWPLINLQLYQSSVADSRQIYYSRHPFQRARTSQYITHARGLGSSCYFDVVAPEFTLYIHRRLLRVVSLCPFFTFFAILCSGCAKSRFQREQLYSHVAHQRLI